MKKSGKIMNTKKMTDMTTGSPVKHILGFAWPLLIGNLFQQLYNMVDSAIVGKFVGADALAAVGTCGAANFLFFSLSAGLAAGIGIIVSQYYGAGDERNVRKTIGNAVYVLTFVSLIVSALGITLTPALLRLLDTPSDIFNDAKTYMITTCSGILAIAIYNGVSSILRALGDSKTPLYFLILSSIVNVVLDLVFVLALRWGVFGVAFATIISQIVSAVTSTIYAYRKVPYFHLKKEQLAFDKAIIAKSFKLGIPVAFQNSMIAVSCMVLQGVVNGYGNTVMAAYTITGRVEQIVQQPYGSLGIALTTYAGQNVGAGRYDRVKEGYKKAVLMVLIFSLLMIPVMFFLGKYIVGIFVSDARVIAMGVKALRITSLCYFGLGMIYIPRSVLNGCGDTGFAMINGLTEVSCRIIYSQILIRIPFLGFWGIWVTTGFTWITTAIVCVTRYVKGKWKNKSIIKHKEDIIDERNTSKWDIRKQSI